MNNIKQTITEVEAALAMAVETEVTSNPALTEAAVAATVTADLDGLVGSKLPSEIGFLKPILVLVIGFLAPTLINSYYTKVQTALAGAASA
jgi:hypothetical protein